MVVHYLHVSSSSLPSSSFLLFWFLSLSLSCLCFIVEYSSVNEWFIRKFKPVLFLLLRSSLLFFFIFSFPLFLPVALFVFLLLNVLLRCCVSSFSSNSSCSFFLFLSPDALPLPLLRLFFFFFFFVVFFFLLFCRSFAIFFFIVLSFLSFAGRTSYPSSSSSCFLFVFILVVFFFSSLLVSTTSSSSSPSSSSSSFFFSMFLYAESTSDSGVQPNGGCAR